MTFLGAYLPDESLNFTTSFDELNFDPTTGNYDVWRADDGSEAWIREANNLSLALLATSYGASQHVSPSAPFALVGATWPVGTKGMVVIKVDGTDTPLTSIILRFEISHLDTALEEAGKIIDQELSDGSVIARPNTVMGRLLTAELNQITNISPKLRRLLGYLGENQVLDAVFFDTASNTTQIRQRVFDTAANAAAAPVWDDTEGTEDPAPAFPGTGEKIRQIILASHSNARQLRTELLGSIDTLDGGSGDAADQAFDRSSVI